MCVLQTTEWALTTNGPINEKYTQYLHKSAPVDINMTYFIELMNLKFDFPLFMLHFSPHYYLFQIILPSHDVSEVEQFQFCHLCLQ